MVQKIAYFSQMRGLPIELRFQRHQYGPYSHPLPHILDRLEGLFIRDDSRTIERSNLRLLDEDEWLNATLSMRRELDAARPAIRSAIDLLCHLDVFKAELLATVHFTWALLLENGFNADEDEVIEYVAGWKADKFSQKAVMSAYRHLRRQGWLAPEPFDPAHPTAAANAEYEALPV